MAGADVKGKGKARQSEQSLNFILRSGLAGGFAGCVAKTVIAPLDRVKILFQTANPDFQRYAGTWTGVFRAAHHIRSDQGLRGLFQGHSATLARVFPYAAIKFMAYDQIHYLLMPTSEHETNLRRFLAGASSGMVSVLFTYPLELIRVRMAFQTRSTPLASSRPSIFLAVSQIYHEGDAVPSSKRATQTVFLRIPWLKFYRGFTVTLLGMVPYAGTSFLAWGFLRSRLLPRPAPTAPDERSPARSSPVLDLGIGAVSGAIAQTVSYPFEVVRRRMQVGGVTRPGAWLGWGETVRAVWAAGGWRGFYVGLSIGYMKVVPMTAISYAVWQWGKHALGV